MQRCFAGGRINQLIEFFGIIREFETNDDLTVDELVQRGFGTDTASDIVHVLNTIGLIERIPGRSTYRYSSTIEETLTRMRHEVAEKAEKVRQLKEMLASANITAGVLPRSHDPESE
jgi:hypothetical protein